MTGRRLLGAALDVLVFALGLYLFARPPSSHDAPSNWDAITYSAASASIARGDGPWFQMDALRLPPLHPVGLSYLLAPLYAFTPGDGLGRGLPGIAALGALTLVCVRRIAARFAGPAAGLLAVPLALLSRELNAATGIVMTDIPFAAAVTLAVAALSGPSPLRAFAGGLVAGAGCWVRPGGMLVLLPLAVLLFASPGRTRRLLAFAAGFAALFLPLLAVNRWLYGGPFRTGYHFYCPALWDYPGPGFELRHAFVTSGRFDGTAGPGNFYRYLRDLIGAPPSPPLLPMPVVALALYGCWRLARAGHRAFAATLIAFAAVLVGFHSMFLYYVERYLLPLVPLTAVAAAAGAVALLRRGRVAATVAAGALGLSAFLAWPGAWAGVNRREGAVVEPGFLAAAARRLEPDAVIVTGLPGPLVQHYLIRGTRRRFVPLVDAHLVYWPEPVPGRPPVPAGADSEDVMRAYWSWSAGRGRREVFLPGADHLLADLELHVVGSLPTYFEDASRRTQPAAWEAVARRFRLEPVERAGADTLYRLHVRPR